MRPLLAVAGALAATACGYGFSTRYVARGGADRIHVRMFENRSTEPELGAAVTAALRGELARRGADGGPEAPAVLEGEVRATEPVLTSLPAPTAAGGQPVAATWRIAIEVRARLLAGEAPVLHAVRRDGAYVGGADALETEGRRAVALRRLADEAARDLLRALER